MSGLTFGSRARRRAQRRRLFALSVLATVAATLAGMPAGPNPFALLDSFRRTSDAADARGPEASDNAASIVRFRRRVFEARPTPPRPDPIPSETAPATESPAAEPVYAGSVSEIIAAAAGEFGLDPGYLLSVATCESGLSTTAVNAAGYYGLFQFDQQTWSAYGYGSIYDPVAQSRTAARLLAAGQSSRWPNCA